VTAIIAAVGASFLASVVEFVEALTIILAVGFTRGWRSSLLGALAAAGLLAAIVAAFGLTLAARLPLPLLRGAIGALLLVFGLNWLRKAIFRYAGVEGLHDEAKRFAGRTAELQQHERAGAIDWLGFVVSLKGTLLEGLEVAFIVITFGLSSGQVGLSALGALAAFVVVGTTGFVVRKPLEQVPENSMKFVVGLMLTTFGTFWAGEGLGVAWPLDDLFILSLLAVYVLYSWLAVRALLARNAWTSAPEMVTAR
jgi:uncharacterized membrane protein